MPLAKTYFKNGQRIDLVSATLTPASVAAASTVEQSFVIPVSSNNGIPILATDVVQVFAPAMGNATGVIGARVTALNTVSLIFSNPTAGALVPAAGTYRFLVYSTQANT